MRLLAYVAPDCEALKMELAEVIAASIQDYREGGSFNMDDPE